MSLPFKTKNCFVIWFQVKWMMYWIVWAFFTCLETFTDVFLSWFPFYYEVKVLLVLWLLSPATKGSSMLYKKFVHPMLTRREQVSWFLFWLRKILVMMSVSKSFEFNSVWKIFELAQKARKLIDWVWEYFEIALFIWFLFLNE